MLNQDELKKKLKYDPLTGVFTWIKPTKHNGNLIGNVAGTINGCGYLQIGINYKYYLCHRLAFLYMTGEFPAAQVDHIDHIKTNNAFDNLRLVSNAENSKNLPLGKRNKTGKVGVKYRKNINRFIARISVNKKDIYLGCFKEFSEAVIARRQAEKKYGFHFNHGNV